MEKQRRLPALEGFDRTTQMAVYQFAANLVDQTRRLKEAVEGLTVEQLEYQPHPGMNTIGMLIAHNCVAEVYWLGVVPRGLKLETDGEALTKATLGIQMDDDGMPCPEDGGHPESLRGRTTADYFTMLDRARELSLAELRTWRDDQLGEILTGYREWTWSREWIAYHAVEHQSGHFGQILMLKHLMRVDGLLPKAPEED